MSFHEYTDNDNDVHISLPTWILDVGRENPDIFFTDQQGRRNKQCLTWGVDKERVLKGRNALEVLGYKMLQKFEIFEFPEVLERSNNTVVEKYLLQVYYDFMRSFRQTFECFFGDGTIVCVEIGLGARGEFQYPSHSKSHGWIYPGIGEFQVLLRCLLSSLFLQVLLVGVSD